MNNARLRQYLLLILIISVALAAVSCSNSYAVTRVNDTHNLLTVKQGIAKYSLEFSINYEVVSVDIRKTYTSITLDGPEVGENHDHTFISIYARILGDGESGYQSIQEEFLNMENNQPDFRILERFPVTIAGESGEELAYYYFWRPPVNLELQGEQPKPVIVRRSIFTHDNLFYRIQLNSIESYADTDKVDFEHVVQTFKIIDFE